LPQKVPIRCPTGDEIDSFELLAQDFAISKPKRIGGHALLGRNGSGKSLLVEYLTHPELFVDADSHHDWNLLHPDDIAYVSFRSHVDMLRDDPHRSVHNVITDGAGNLSRAAQYMVVRFGLFPLLYRTLSTLSTGEVRKTLLVSALCQDPKLLILENAFDGLDVKSRQELKAIVSKTIQGLENSGKLLIQQVQASNVNPTQVLLSTHRPEEIVDEISTVTMTLEDDTRTNRYNMVTIQRPRDYSQERLMYTALGLDKDYSISKKFSQVAPLEDIDPSLPSLEEIQSVWTANRDVTPATLISLNNVEIRRHRDGASIKDEGDATLLHALTWKIERGQRWLIAGGNGAGKVGIESF
jgi:molybdate transport system ATP-binding protein